MESAIDGVQVDSVSYIRNLFEQSLVGENILKKLGKVPVKLWVSPFAVDVILQYGTHEQLCYGNQSLRRPGDTDDDDHIPWSYRALENGWIRVSINSSGTEMNLEFSQTGKLKKSVSGIKEIIQYLPQLETCYAEIHHRGEVRQETWQSKNLIFCLNALSRS